MASEFDLIYKYFSRATNHTRLGVGDDAALIEVMSGHELAISADMLVAGTHFFNDTDARKLGWKSLAVNISDMAAMGAEPKWATLAIAFPDADESWIADFAEGFFACAHQFGVDLIGGDTTRGPLCISVQIMGQVPAGKAIKRSGAKVGDDIWVSGKLGDAALALNHLLGKHPLTDDVLDQTMPALLEPEPRVLLGLALRDIAHSAIDVSDGLLADLGHILKASKVGAMVNLAVIPCSDILRQHMNHPFLRNMLLAGGDDYELCFTAAISDRAKIQAIGNELDLPLSRIGEICDTELLTVQDANGNTMELGKTGFDHFKQ